MSLGIGGATPYSQASNHQTAANHTHRDVQKYDHTKQTKVKCTSCGMWAPKGGACTFCKQPPPGTQRSSLPSRDAKAPKEKVTVSDNALTHTHRDTEKYDHSKQTKVKCTSCGCWAKKGGNCTLCKRPVA
ncbi:hypothetical protein DIPPA_24048 [Diplonema papillatum]|nr:hypothetical protein DIPPA_24048 [Diplonema papillatum]